MERRTYSRQTTADTSGHPADPEVATETTEVETREVSTPAYTNTVSDHAYGTMYLESLPARVNAVIFAMLFALEGLLALRFTLAAFGANRTSGFVDFIMDLSWPFVRPFDGAFANRTWDEGIIEVSTLLAMGVWFLGFMLVVTLVNALMPRFYGEDTTVHHRRVTHV